MIRTDLLASPEQSTRDATNLAGELKAARRVLVRRGLRLAAAAKDAAGEPARSRAYRVALGRWRQAASRVAALQQEIPVPTRFYLLGIIPVGKIYGVPGWAKAKTLLPWWARWAVSARKVREKRRPPRGGYQPENGPRDPRPPQGGTGESGR